MCLPRMHWLAVGVAACLVAHVIAEKSSDLKSGNDVLSLGSVDTEMPSSSYSATFYEVPHNMYFHEPIGYNRRSAQTDGDTKESQSSVLGASSGGFNLQQFSPGFGGHGVYPYQAGALSQGFPGFPDPLNPYAGAAFQQGPGHLGIRNPFRGNLGGFGLNHYPLGSGMQNQQQYRQILEAALPQLRQQIDNRYIQQQLLGRQNPALGGLGFGRGGLRGSPFFGGNNAFLGGGNGAFLGGGNGAFLGAGNNGLGGRPSLQLPHPHFAQQPFGGPPLDRHLRHASPLGGLLGGFGGAGFFPQHQGFNFQQFGAQLQDQGADSDKASRRSTYGYPSQ